LIRDLTLRGRWQISLHAEASMIARAVVPEDLRSVLVGAETCHAEPPDRWLLVGPDAVGEPLSVVVEVRGGVVVVTMFRGDEP
jgi:hypothetical protein